MKKYIYITERALSQGEVTFLPGQEIIHDNNNYYVNLTM